MKTATGLTETAEARYLMVQGTAAAGLVSQLNLDIGLQKYFAGSGVKMYYEGICVKYIHGISR